jgi:hypothetical protein
MKLVDNRLNRLEKNLQQGKMIQEIQPITKTARCQHKRTTKMD